MPQHSEGSSSDDEENEAQYNYVRGDGDERLIASLREVCDRFKNRQHENGWKHRFMNALNERLRYMYE